MKFDPKAEIRHVRHIPKSPSEGETLQKAEPFFNISVFNKIIYFEQINHFIRIAWTLYPHIFF